MKGILSLLVLMAGCMVMLMTMTSATLTALNRRHHRHQFNHFELASLRQRLVKPITES